MKKIFIILFIFLSLLLFSSCSVDKNDYNTVYNYMQSTSLVSCGNHFIKLENKVPYVFDENKNRGYSIVDNAVELSQAGIIRILYADDDSFYYSTVEAANTYGNGNGYRIYRYFPESQKKELVFSDVSVTNFDSTLGLEDVFNISAPTSDHSISFSSGFYFDEETVIPDYKMKLIILEAIEKQALDIELFSIGFRFAVTDNKALFTDVLGGLWQYDPKMGAIKKFYNETVSDFFVTEKNIFVISNVTDKISVLDLNGNLLKELETKGADFSLNSLQVSNGACFLLDDSGSIWYIDSNLNMSKTLFKSSSSYWCIRDKQIMIYEKGYTLRDIDSGLHEKHNFKVVKTVKPSCAKPGKKEYECICGETYTKKIALLAHVPSKRVLCTDEIVCVNCKTVIEPPKDHDLSSEGTYNNDATCLGNGTVMVKCSLCNYTEISEATNTALGHDMTGERLYNNDASCEKDGTETIHCSRCDYIEINIIPDTALGHEDNDDDGLCDRCQTKTRNDGLVDVINSLREYILN